MTTVEDLTPAALTPESLARVHALWSWTYRMDVCQLQAAMAKLSVRELRDVRLANDMLGSYTTVELLRRAAPTAGQVAAAILTPDAEGQPFDEVAPPLPAEPPVGSVVLFGGEAVQRFEDNDLAGDPLAHWAGVGSTARYTWPRLNEINSGHPVLLLWTTEAQS